LKRFKNKLGVPSIKHVALISTRLSKRGTYLINSPYNYSLHYYVDDMHDDGSLSDDDDDDDDDEMMMRMMMVDLMMGDDDFR
jgi:hypothetical protein